MKRWMIEWDVDVPGREQIIYDSQADALAACAKLTDETPAGFPQPLVVEVVAGVFDALQARSKRQ
jgi:hypothetical protein